MSLKGLPLLLLALPLAAAPLRADELDAAAKAELHLSRGDYDLAEKEAAKSSDPRAKELLEEARGAKASGASGASRKRPSPPRRAAGDKAEREAELMRQGEEAAQAEAQAREEARLKKEADAKAQAEEKLKLEAAARLKAEEDAKAKAEEEARLKREAEAKAEEEKAKLEAAARLKAEEEARARVEAEARARTEAEKKALDEERARLEAEKRALAEEREQVRREREAARDGAKDAKAEGAGLPRGGIAFHYGLYDFELKSRLESSSHNNPPGTQNFFPQLKQPSRVETTGHFGTQLRWRDFFFGAAATFAEGGYWHDTSNQPPSAPWNPRNLELKVFQFALGWEWNFWRARSAPGFGIYLPLAAEYSLGYAYTGGSPYVGQVPGAYTGLGLRFTPWRFLALELEGLFHAPLGHGEFQDEYGKSFKIPEGTVAMDSLGPNIRLKSSFMLW